MKLIRIAVLLLIVNFNLAPIANATLIRNPDGLRVYDTFLKVTWAANANLGSTDGAFGLPACDKGTPEPCVDPGGAMGYLSATYLVEALNGLHLLPPYLGHTTWTIPRIEKTDPNCTVRNWAYNCMNSALGSLYYQSLPSGDGNFGFTYPDTAVPIPPNEFGPFQNFQPYLYWTSSAGNGSGESTFSFNTGWQGSNHKFHYMYVLPMVPRQVQGINYIKVSANSHLEVSSDGQLVWDPDAVDANTGANGVTWLADANLPLKEKFGLEKCRTHGRACINSDGSMKYTTALTWLDRMKKYQNVGWLGQPDWAFPSADPNGGCDLPRLHCAGGPLGELYFNELGLKQGTPVFEMSNFHLGPFYNLQPYLYWSCMGPDPCKGPQPPHGDQEWSFSFGNGYQGTDIVHNNLYVMVYYPQTPAEALDEGVRDELPNDPQLRHQLRSEAALISSVATYNLMVAALNLFKADVNAQAGTLTPTEAAYLIALAQATADARGLQPPPPPPPPPPCKPHCI